MPQFQWWPEQRAPAGLLMLIAAAMMIAFATFPPELNRASVLNAAAADVLALYDADAGLFRDSAGAQPSFAASEVAVDALFHLEFVGGLGTDAARAKWHAVKQGHRDARPRVAELEAVEDVAKAALLARQLVGAPRGTAPGEGREEFKVEVAAAYESIRIAARAAEGKWLGADLGLEASCAC